MELPVVLGDYREPEERADELRVLGLEVWHDPVHHEPELEFGDWAWTSLNQQISIGIEVKTAAEALTRFQSPKTSGRHGRSLQEQLHGLHASYDIPIFLYGGRIQQTADGFCRVYGFDRMLNYDGWHNWLHMSLPRDLPGILIDHIDDDRFLMKRVFSLIKYFEKTQERRATWSVTDRRPLFAVDEDEISALTSLMAFPKVGEELARRILQSGLSVWEALDDIERNAGERVREVEGLGPERVRQIRRVLDWHARRPPEAVG